MGRGSPSAVQGRTRTRCQPSSKSIRSSLGNETLAWVLAVFQTRTFREAPTGPASWETICTVKWSSPWIRRGWGSTSTTTPKVRRSSRRQHLLPDQIGQPVVRFLVTGDDGKVGLHAHERDPVGHDPGAELPLVERQIPVLAVEDDVARPCRGIFDARFRQILGQPPPQPPVDEIEVQHPAEHRRIPVREPPDAFEVLAHAPPGGGRDRRRA